jgi:hypothetical protein
VPIHLRVTALIMIVICMAACSSAPASVPESDRVATGVAEARAVAATLTAGAPTTVPPTAVDTQVLPTETSLNASTATPAPLPPTDTVVPPTATSVPPTPKPTVAAPKPPTPTKAAVAQQADPFVPGGGDPKGLVGRIYLPGYGGGPKVNHPSFNEEISVQLFVYDPDIGDSDGAGIKTVAFDITDPNGETVWSTVEQRPRYCAFDGEGGCTIWSFPPNGNRWPNGKRVCKGDGYQIQMTVRTEDDSRDNALWQFNFAIDGDYPPC